MLGPALTLTLVPVIAALISGVAAAIRRPGPRLTSALQHFAAGVIFSAAAIELLPTVLQHSPLVAILGFAGGIAVMFTFRTVGAKITAKREARGALGLPVGLITATAIDFLVDGVILGAGFTANVAAGALLTIALAVEYLFVGISLSAALSKPLPRAVVAVLPGALSLLTVAGTVLGVLALSTASPTVQAAVLAFGAVAFMYLATEELLVEAHEKGETSIGSIGFFIGFLIYLILTELLH